MMVINSPKIVIDVLIINILIPEIFNKFNFKCTRSYNFSKADGKSVPNQVIFVIISAVSS